MVRQIANFGVLFHAVFFVTFLLFTGGFGLFLLGELHKMCVITEAKKLGLFASVLNRVFPFPEKKYEFNLTHVVLFSMLIALLSMMHHPAQDVILHDVEKEEKKVAKKEEAEKKKKKQEEKNSSKESKK
mmetsp:Transcript_32054/g.51589  ORF Transcript_32054/g.51589 Transcript_32054/m.51589 type:complete len:129 (+) Transcript_32054:72-458(+)|eukprot:CAMPEP_0115083890 /NCGR_PEP_ID=MMETSP0227-20121206/20883_1 /TAXON_ID=89957 /ORGANISM="Polarella glacialis, Strain CCMP 1383" /LENGTH=128 /DNA_ID=CAMNT_0002472491 /DNA_START=53 /DNA_END=439 /DNA_ORIENTATION=+